MPDDLKIFFHDALNLTVEVINGKSGATGRRNYLSNLRIIIKKHLGLGNARITLNGYKVSYGNFEHLYKIYDELFNQEVYLFKTDNAVPFIIDAGANVGLATLYFKMLYPASNIIAFEPEPVTFGHLQRNIKDNHIREVTLVNKALCETRGEACFFRDAGKDCSWASSFYDDAFVRAGNGHETISVECDTLSSYIDRHVDMLKMDIEGAETGVMVELYESGKLSLVDRMIIEYHNFIGEKEGLVKILDILTKAGYSYRGINGTAVDIDDEKLYVLLIYADKTGI